jgi:hypothetical protein
MLSPCKMQLVPLLPRALHAACDKTDPVQRRGRLLHPSNPLHSQPSVVPTPPWNFLFKHMIGERIVLFGLLRRGWLGVFPPNVGAEAMTLKTLC